MKRITKEQQALIDASIVACGKSRYEIQKLVEEYNEFVNEWGERTEKAVARYNDDLNDLRGTYQSIAETAQEYYDERTETWQNGDKGQAYAEWISELENPDIDDFDFDIPAPIDEPDFQDWDDLHFLPADEPD